MMRNNSVYGIIAAASNVKCDKHPPYTVDDFLKMYPQFMETESLMIEAWLNIAFHSLQYCRWRDFWCVGVGLFVAHHVTLSTQPQTAGDVEAGLSKGIVGSKSVGDLSISYDFGSIANEFQGWGTYSQTVYGQQLVGLAKMVGKGGMTVW